MQKEQHIIQSDTTAELIYNVLCTHCRRETKHKVLHSIETDDMGQMDGDQFLCEIIQCQGCGTFSFRHTITEVSPGPGWDYVCHTSLYPNREARQPIKDASLLPETVERIYKETIMALNANQPVLAGIGIRALIETVCKDKKAVGANLSKQIDNLVMSGVLTTDGAKTLHNLRVLGNASAHEVKPHKIAQLLLAIDVAEHLLQGVYILPYHAKNSFPYSI